MMPTRLHDWPERLDAALTAARARSFDLGKWDCGYFVVSVALAITGVDFGEQWRGTYDSEFGLARLFASLGVDDLAGWATAALGVDQQSVKLARRGDWVLSPSPHPLALGICTGVESVFIGPEGWHSWRTLSCRTSWPVGI